MMQDEEPDEGDIPAAGRTYRGAFKPWNKESISGIQLLLGNLTSSQVRGAKMLIGISSNGNADLLPTNNGVANNVVTGNARTGWVQVTVGGASDLPVRADVDGTGLAWTDLVSFSPALQANENVDVVWRIWLPSRATAKYARTFSGGRSYTDHKLNPIASLVALRRELLGTSDWWNFAPADGFGRAEGDCVTTPAASTTWVLTPNPGGTFAAYGKDYVSSIPILGYRFKAARALPLIEFVGDSIMQGYADGEQTVGIDGTTGRMLRAMGSGSTASFSIVNFGLSGFTPEQYLARWKGLARADTHGATAMVYSIYSPNGFADGVHSTQARIDAMKQNTLDAETAAKSLGRLFIPAFITGTNMNLSSENTGLVKNLLDWAKQRYGTQLLDLHDAINDTSTVGPSMLSKYTNDWTHPNAPGYDALGAKAISIFPTIYSNARAAQISQ
ncbi:MAG: hypothetical protein H6R19_206 [Proteobacteria bacterium]|nr:hypothetical protein [Pseudomonadota bacterium]